MAVWVLCIALMFDKLSLLPVLNNVVRHLVHEPDPQILAIGTILGE